MRSSLRGKYDMNRKSGQNRFFDIDGDVSMQLAPWVLRKEGYPEGAAYFDLKIPIRFYSDIAKGVIVVPEGYRSDLASIPQFAWSVFMKPDDPRIELGGWIHDYLYEKEGKNIPLEDGRKISLSRKETDRILTEEAMPDLLANDFQCETVYHILRKFGKGWTNDSFWERFN